MTLREKRNTSIIVSLFIYSYRWYKYVEQKLTDIYRHSQTHILINRFWIKTRIYFKYSFLGKITEIKQPISGVLDSSRVVQYLINFYKRGKDRRIQYFKTSSMSDLAKETKEQFISSPLKVINMIIVIAITGNLFLSIVLQKQISLWGWLVRGLFLSAGIAGLFCKADWQTVKRNSIILRKIGID